MRTVEASIPPLLVIDVLGSFEGINCILGFKTSP
jgi:hypothetical protein